MGYPARIGLEPGIVLPFWPPKPITENPKETLVSSAEEDIAILGLEGTVWDNRRCDSLCYWLGHPGRTRDIPLTVSCTPAPSILPSADQAAASNICQCSSLTIAESCINVLPSPSLCPREQRCHNGIARVKPSRQISHSNPDFNGRAISASGDVHEPKLSLHHNIVPGAT